MIKIGVDLISGESDLKQLIKGCRDATEKDSEIEVVVIGKRALFEPLLVHKSPFFWDKPKPFERISIIDASDVITMDDDPIKVIKEKKESSIVKGLEAHKRMEIDAFFSPGNTGAIVVASSLIMGRTKGIKKPALGAYMPNNVGNYNLLLDVGASAECEATDLVRFAIMGRIYYREMMGVPSPRVGLLNIGSEAHKGTAIHRKTYQMLSEMDVNFIGNIEGKDVFSEKVDVIVADGATGNTTLKVAEGVAKTVAKLLKKSIIEDPMAKIAAPLFYTAMKKLKGYIDPESHGGVPLLGVNGNVFIGHGTSGRQAICNGILNAAKAVRHDLLGNIHRRLEELHLI